MIQGLLKRSEQCMQALQQQDFRALVDNHPKAIMLATREPRILYVNEKFRSVTGYRSDEVLGQPPSVLSSGFHSREFYQSMWRAIGHKGRWEGLVWNRRKNGETYPQWLMIYPVEHENHRFYAGVFMDVGDMTADDERLASLAYYDPLTELPNRALFQEFLKARVSQRVKDGQAFAVLYIDLDFFKSVNDLHGHDCGDRVLQQAALCIQSVLRRGDVVARLSGDEFAAIIELRNDDDLESVCQRMVQSFRAPVIVDHREYFLSSSVGAAVYPDHGSQASELLQNADRAMYAAKLAGRACFRIYDAVDTEQGRQAELLSEALIVSLKTAPEEFTVVYQPQYHLDTGKMAGLEALLRWTHPEFGAVSPADFVPIAEQRGHIHELTEHLVRCIESDLSEFPASFLRGLRLALNISARQITDSRLEALLNPLFERIRAVGWRPEIEITETHLMNLSRQCLDRLAEFCEQGVVVAIDDFGTGYSSLAYLHTLPVQVLKIDRQFTQRLGGESRDSRIVSAILAIADALELEVVAEGIENAEQHAKLRELKCQRGQGYLMARPAPWRVWSANLIDHSQEKSK
ncbi:EAL domain-containing protein [Marinobacter flavimaris]|jgi:diguanylate cyclase (GGDEF)-like protein/PAS domain S-box-containing protein|uniref:EAL domain-containing protein n=2 Tax=Marinobacter TaxID=2742 RepID=A0A3D8H1F3_9GAMM|nr:PAS domain S-box protein [Marinobacter flavimaris]RDU40560.1 EAL domain-containing protein [Marinobacter flavimaris]HAS75364.1 GGDEF domain-containing protein [Marinobacter adhaerens]HAZ88999.1 GGDEF domain-containing protein [Marinobacter adhaerens]HBF94411.1 GGDEF domain-containing protein [Marinobacter adhaerens]|tara:strand:- start:2547 stop:4271 length:1725 start_codon:yes stop_codon:yes gene_type:complete